MKSFQILWCLVVLGSVQGQYNFQREQNPAGYNYRQPTPAPTYLPPTSPPTKSPYEEETDVAAEGQGPPRDDQDHAPGMPYDFTYAVKDDFGNDFAHKADSDGEVVKGEYRTLMADGRMQIVKYTADWKNGFNAEVTYEGEARPYVAPPTTRAPYFPPQQTTRPPYVPPTSRPDEDEEQVDSQGSYPTTPQPFRCYPGSSDPRCPPSCYPGSTDPRCPPPTTSRPVCYPGSTDPRCPPPPTQAPRCYPGSFDPRCPTQRTTTEPPTLPPGLYGAPSLPFGVRNNPKFGYN